MIVAMNEIEQQIAECQRIGPLIGLKIMAFQYNDYHHAPIDCEFHFADPSIWITKVHTFSPSDGAFRILTHYLPTFVLYHLRTNPTSKTWEAKVQRIMGDDTAAGLWAACLASPDDEGRRGILYDRLLELGWGE